MARQLINAANQVHMKMTEVDLLMTVTSESHIILTVGNVDGANPLSTWSILHNS